MAKNSARMALTAAMLAAAAQAQIAWEMDYETALAAAKAANKPLLIDFYADWCGPCKMMDAQTFPDRGVQKAVSEQFIPVKIDVDANERVAFAYKIQSIPRTIVLNVFGEIAGDRVGFLDAEGYLAFLNDVADYTHRKLDGIVVTVPEAKEVMADPESLVGADTAFAELSELVCHPDPKVREQAQSEMLRRDPGQVAAFVAQALRHEYLGMRIAAAAMMQQMRQESGYDPWAGKEARIEALRK